MAKVSIIIPVYNGGRYLDRCLRSVTGQSYEDIEVLLINDGSADSTGEICREYAAKDPRIIYIPLEENLGASQARNKGLEESKGEYIAFADADDEVEKDFVSRCVDIFEEKSCDCVFCGFERYTESGRMIGGGCKRPVGNASGKEIGPLLRTKAYDCNIWAKMFRREMIFDSQGYVKFSSSFSVGEDYDWLIRVLCNCRSVQLCPESFYRYYQLDNSLSRSFRLDERNFSHLQMYDNALRQSFIDDIGARADLEYRLFTQLRIFYVSAIVNRDEESMGKIRKISDNNPGIRDSWMKDDQTNAVSRVKEVLMELALKCGLDRSWAAAIYNMFRKNRITADNDF